MRVPLLAISLLVLSSCGSSAFAQSTQPSLANILQNLGSSDFAVRDAAQAALSKIPSDQFDTLKQAAAAAPDAEVKARLEQRLAEIQRVLLFHPGGITIDVTKAPLADVVKLINAQVKETKGPVGPVDFLQARGPKAGSFTLHIKNASFVDVLRAMNEQYPLNFISSNSVAIPIEIADTPGSLPAWSYSADGSFAFLTTITKLAPFVQDNVLVEPAKFRVQCRMFFDPRVHLAWYETNPHWTMQDDRRHILVGDNPQAAPNRWPVLNLRQVNRFEERLLIPDRPGTRIVTGKTLLHCAVAEDFIRAEIADVRMIFGAQEVRLGDKTFRVAINPNGLGGFTEFTHSLWTGDPPVETTMPGMVLVLYDGDDLFRWQPGLPKSPGQIRLSDNPMKLKIYYPTKVTPVEVQVEISDVPLP
jgi:hypothetical protein